MTKATSQDLEDRVNAFTEFERRQGAAAGPMAGLSFAAKDVFDVGGYVAGCGNPEWARRHDAALETAPVIEAMPMAGADFVGTIRTDERAYSPMGVNARMPDGSFSGAVAADLMDVAL